MSKRFLSSLLAVLMILLLVPVPALADAESALSKSSDTEPPTVTNITLSGTTINAPGSVTATVACADNDSGVARCQISFRNINNTSGFTDGSVGFALSEGSDGTWSGQIALNENHQSGAYVISFVTVADNAGNSVTYLGDGWPHEPTADAVFLPANLASLTITVTNNNPADFEPPTLSSLTLSAASIAAPGSVTVTANCADDGTGVAGVMVMFENAAEQTNLGCSLREESAGIWAGQITVDENTRPGDYVISQVMLSDQRMNSRTYYGEGNLGYANAPESQRLPANLASLKITVIDSSLLPRITMQPRDVTADAGSTATFTVTARDATAYQWQYRRSASGAWANSPAAGNKTDTLKIDVTAGKNGYQYRCVVSNDAGSVESLAATLRIPTVKPTITLQPADRLVTPGDIAYFVVGTEEATAWQWQFRRSATGSWANATASGNKTSMLGVPATASKNGYEYRCKVSNAKGTVYSSTAKLTVWPAPVISAQPQNTSAAVGGTAVFSVKASNATGYQWQFRKSASGAWANATASGNKTATLNVPATANKNGYQYRCKVTNEAWTFYSGIATLTVTSAAKPSITKQPANASVPVGGTAVFSVTATGATGWQWQFRKSADGAWANAGADGNKTATLNVPVTANKNGYQYRCKVSNAAGTVYTSVVTLTVQSKPVITAQPTNVSAPVGGTAVFSVTATGAVSYQWQFRKTADGAWANAGASGNQTATLSVPAAASKNGYQYRCKVSNAAGTVYTSVVTLTVQSKPVITVQPTNASAPVGGTAVFSVTATGAVSYQWQFRKTADGAWANASASGNQTATLSVPAAANKNGYQYRCAVSNAAGTVYTSVVTLSVG